jgi:hypothetical protein
MVVAEGTAATVTIRVISPEIPRLQATGTPIPIRVINERTNIRILIYSIELGFLGLKMIGYLKNLIIHYQKP